jgi:hypothetical protein
VHKRSCAIHDAVSYQFHSVMSHGSIPGGTGGG